MMDLALILNSPRIEGAEEEKRVHVEASPISELLEPDLRFPSFGLEALPAPMLVRISHI